MKSRFLSFALCVLFVVPVLAFAGSKNSSNLNLDQTVKVAGTQLAPGQYKVTWEGSGPDVQVSFLEGKKIIATAPARIATAPKSQETAIETATTADAVVLRAIDLKNLSLHFDDAVSVQGN